MAYWTESIGAGNGRNNVVCYHLANSAVATTAAAILVSGFWSADYDKVSVNFANTHSGSAVNFQCWVANASGLSQSGTVSPLYSSVSGGTVWAALGDPITVAAGNASAKSWETTVGKFFAVTGSASAAIASGVNVDLFCKMRA